MTGYYSIIFTVGRNLILTTRITMIKAIKLFFPLIIFFLIATSGTFQVSNHNGFSPLFGEPYAFDGHGQNIQLAKAKSVRTPKKKKVKKKEKKQKALEQKKQIQFEKRRKNKAEKNKPRGDKTYYRNMSKKEAQAVKESGKLRGGRSGETFFTDSRFKTGEKAKDRLSLPEKPEVQMEFEIKNKPKLEKNGVKVEPEFGGRGGGKEYMTKDPVKVEIKNVQPFKK